MENTRKEFSTQLADGVIAQKKTPAERTAFVTKMLDELFADTADFQQADWKALNDIFERFKNSIPQSEAVKFASKIQRGVSRTYREDLSKEKSIGPAKRRLYIVD